MSNNIEIMAKLLSDKTGLQNDMGLAMDGVKQMFMEKYLSKLNQTVKAYNESIIENPSKEVRLLDAMTYFYPDEKKQTLQKLIQVLNTIDTIKTIGGELSINMGMHPGIRTMQNETEDYYSPQGLPQGHSTAQGYPSPQSYSSAQSFPPYGDSSVHPDGVYDMDDACLYRQHHGGISTPFSPLPLLGIMLMLRRA